LKWDHTPEEIRQLSKKLIEDSTKTINAMIANKEPRNFKNVIEVLAKFESDFDIVSS
jgi:Zn-dependent oligopeptidase